jgi:hypothetical protein
MRRFEYKTLQMPLKGTFGMRIDYELLEKELNELGNKGWEVITAPHTNYREAKKSGTIIILKREIN